MTGQQIPSTTENDTGLVKCRGKADAYFLSFATELEVSIRATAGSDEVRAEAKLASGVSPSDEMTFRVLCGAMACVFVRLRIC